MVDGCRRSGEHSSYRPVFGVYLALALPNETYFLGGEVVLKETVTSVAENFKERAASPLLGSYTVAALACNWKPIVVLATSQKKSVDLIAETVSVFPGFTQSLLYPAAFALGFALLYPTLKAAIATFNTQARIMDLRAEYRMEEWKERLSVKRRSDVEAIIETLMDLTSHDRIGYHDLKRIHDVLPLPEHVQIRQS